MTKGFLLFIGLICMGWSHPIHISVTEITYSDKDKALQLTTRLFIDDLELAIRKKVKNEELDILEPPPGQTTDQYVKEYLAEHLVLKVDGKVVKGSYLGFEKEDVALICYIEFPGVKKMKRLDVWYNAIMEIHDDQSNLVHVTYKSPVKSTRLLADKPQDVFTFEGK